MIELFMALAAFIPEFRELLSSQLGGLFINRLSATEFQRQFARFEEEIKTSNERSMGIIRNILGISEPTEGGLRVREGLNAETTAAIQRRIDAGTAPETWLGQFTEMAPAGPSEFPSAIQGAFDLARQGTEFAGEHFDPDQAVVRYNEALSSTVEGFEGLRGDITGMNQRVQDLYTTLQEQLETGSANVMEMYGGLRGEFETGREDVMGIYTGLRAQLEAGRQDVMGLYGGLREELRTGAEELRGGYEDILGRARGLVSTLGEAERQDITRRFGEAETEMRMGLAGRGLGGGTIEASLAAGGERERSTALLGLEEQMVGQRLGVEQTFGLPALTAQERLLGAGINLGAAQAGAAERFVGAGVNLGAAQAGAAERFAGAGLNLGMAGAGAAERFVGAGLNLGGQQAGAMQFGNQLYANTAMGSLGALGNIAGGQSGAYNQAAMNYLANLGFFGQMPGQAQMQGAGMALGCQGGQTAIMPSYPQQAQVYPSWGGF